MSKLKRLTTGALATLLEVDIKTVHNWVESGRLSQPERTLAGHMRFDAVAVSADYQRAGATVPEPLSVYIANGEPLETPTQRARKLPLKVLRAEIARREQQGAA